MENNNEQTLFGSYPDRVGKDVRPAFLPNQGYGGNFLMPNNQQQDKNENNFLDGNFKELINSPTDTEYNKLSKQDKETLQHTKKPFQKKLKIIIQNIRGLMSPEKQYYVANNFDRNKADIYGLTETNLSERTEHQLALSYKGKARIIKNSSENDTPRGNGIFTIVRYPLAANISKIRKIPGRVTNIILKGHKRRELSIYIVQCPTAPYSAGCLETEILSQNLGEYMENDLSKNREIILGGDVNSYPDQILDYDGPNVGKSPSKIIHLLQNINLVDIMREVNNEPFYTFHACQTKSRLDHFWVSPRMAHKTISVKMGEFDGYISDHTEIDGCFLWENISKQNKEQHRIIWSTKNKAKLNLWQYKMNSKLHSINFQVSENFK